MPESLWQQSDSHDGVGRTLLNFATGTIAVGGIAAVITTLGLDSEKKIAALLGCIVVGFMILSELPDLTESVFTLLKGLWHVLTISLLVFPLLGKLFELTTKAAARKVAKSKSLKDLFEYYQQTMYEPSLTELEAKYAGRRSEKSLFLDESENRKFEREKKILLFLCVYEAGLDYIKETLVMRANGTHRKL